MLAAENLRYVNGCHVVCLFPSFREQKVEIAYWKRSTSLTLVVVVV